MQQIAIGLAMNFCSNKNDTENIVEKLKCITQDNKSYGVI